MKRIISLLLVAACSGVSEDPDHIGSYDEEVSSFQRVLCELESTCFGKDENECMRDVAEDLEYASTILDAEGERRCASCLNTKSLEFQKILDASCDVAAANEAAVFDSCDLNPDDGTQTDDEACAGYP